MSTLWWVGVSPDAEAWGEDIANQINEQVTGILTERAPGPFATIEEADGSARERHRVGEVTVTDFFDRLGNRIGFGIEAADEDDARSRYAEACQQMQELGVDDFVSIWTWNRTAVPVEAPELVVGVG